MKPCFIPELSTQAGSCLTAANWIDAGVEIVAYALSALLMKPGITFLKTLPNLATYVGWPKSLVLNVADLTRDAHGLYSLHSRYDGSMTQYTAHDLLDLILRLSPQYVILPHGFCREDERLWLALPDTVLPFFSVADYPKNTTDRAYGIYIDQNECDESQLLQRLNVYPNYPRYVRGDLNLLQRCDVTDVCYVESNAPAHDAYQGLVYHQEGVIDLTHDSEAMQFAVIDPICQCLTCEQQLTRAYLHHLLQHTPLLCQRFLIQHNVFQINHLRQAEISL